MTAHLSLDPAHSALLCMDYQTGIVSIYAKDQDLLPRAASVLIQARGAGMTVIYVQVGFRPNFPEISSSNVLLSAIRNSPQHQKLFVGPASAIHSSVAPEQDDILVTKHRVSAFTGTDLDMILRAKSIETLILFGIRNQRRSPFHCAPCRRRRLPAHRDKRLLCRYGYGSSCLPGGQGVSPPGHRGFSRGIFRRDQSNPVNPAC